VAGSELAALRAFAKLDQLLPARLRRRVSALQQATARLRDPGGEEASPTVLITAALACRERALLTFEYLDGRAQASQRAVEPYQLVAAGRRWYLLAWDPSRDDWRTFRADRMRSAATTGERFVARRLPRAATELVQQALASGPYRYQAKLLVHASAAEVQAKTSPSAGRVEPRDDNSCVLHAGANDLESLALYVVLKGFDVEVLEPAELRAALRAVGRRCLRAARGKARR
jgi:predicted DNA-binding transcriptional regulator YafY